MSRKSIIGVIIISIVLIGVIFVNLFSFLVKKENNEDKVLKNSFEGKQIEELYFSTGNLSGTYYPLGKAIADSWNRKIDGTYTIIRPSGGSVENLNLISNGEVDVILAMNNIVSLANEGNNKYFRQKLDGYKALGVVYPEVIHIITRKDLKLETISDLKGKKINPGPPGSGTYVTAINILEAYGLPIEELELKPEKFSSTVSNLRDGKIDAAFVVVSFPANIIKKIADEIDINLLGISDEYFTKLKKEIPFIEKYSMTGNVYNGQDSEVTTLSLQAVMYVKEDLSKDLVYKLTKNLYENKSDIGDYYPRGKQIFLENAMDGITTEFHPGALMYYKEKDLIKNEN